MTDVFTPEKRSEVMSLIRGKGNRSTELALIRFLRAHHITGWRRNRPLFGSPDFVFPKQRIAVFVDGCFWHACPLHRTMPATNRAFWEGKLERNQSHDRLVTRTLRRKGWRVMRIWEHALSRKFERRLLARISLYGLADASRV